MAQIQNRRLSTDIILADETALMALKAITAYQPFNQDHSVASLTAKQDVLRATQEAEVKAQNAFNAARDAAIAAQWDFHNGILAAKDHVVGQFGSNSDEVAALGLKKKSDRKAPVRKKKAAEA